MFRYAICNETFQGWEHAHICAHIAELGYTGLEIAPFTLAERITDVTAHQRAELRRQAEAAGVQILGLHWLLARTEGFHLTSPDPDVRQRTGEYLTQLAHAAADLGGNILVLGSPAQRSFPPTITLQQAQDYALDTLRYCLPALEQRRVYLCLEPLASSETNFLNTAAEAVSLAQRLDHPYVRLHLDVKAMAAETQPAPAIIRAFAPWLTHFHANDPNKRGPGFGQTDFRPILQALRDVRYTGWISV
ncbi:MAG: sugar phosphate isomerase/epimerase, partial [Gemmataceae bacterium]|nr:sugar phosphate isomerase/epimerase [Gemmataceae bacterium]